MQDEAIKGKTFPFAKRGQANTKRNDDERKGEFGGEKFNAEKKAPKKGENRGSSFENGAEGHGEELECNVGEADFKRSGNANGKDVISELASCERFGSPGGSTRHDESPDGSYGVGEGGDCKRE